MNRLLKIALVFFSLVGVAHGETMIHEYPGHGTPATSADKLVTIDSDTATKVRNILFSGSATDVLTGTGTWLDTSTFLEDYTETDPIFSAWDKDYADLINTPTIPDVTNYISKTNTTPYTPTADYHPATKGYVDATVVGEGGYVAGGGIDITAGVISSTVVDTDTDTLVTLDCSASQGPVWNGTAWVCGSTVQDGTTDGDILQWDTDEWSPTTPQEITFGAGFSYDPETGEVTFSGDGTDNQTAEEVNITDSGGYFTGTQVEAALQELGADVAAIEVGSLATTAPTYSDDDCTLGEYAFDSTYFYACRATDTWDRIAFAGWSNPTPTVPTLTSATLGTDGETLTLLFSEAVTQGSGYADSQLDLDASVTGNDIGLTYVSGDTTNTHVYTAASVVDEDETVDLDFDGTANSLESSTGGDLAAISSVSVTNNSIQGTSYLVDEGFEAYDAENDPPTGWTVISGTQTWYSTTSPAPLTGTYSWSSEAKATYPLGTSYTDLYMAAKVYLGGSGTRYPFQISPFSNGSARGTVYLLSGGRMCVKAYGGTEDCSDNDVYTDGDTLYLKAHFVSGSGLDASITLWSSTDGSTWTEQAKSEDGTYTGNWTYPVMGSIGLIYDEVRINDADINY